MGLGKTIEVGLRLAAWRRRGRARRVLVVCPSGLTRQWQAEMRFKFEQVFHIYASDFFVNDAAHWPPNAQVIVSLDLAKRENHLAVRTAAEPWDVVIFDEAHRLSRHADGRRAERCKLAEALRPRARDFLLLTGTPHQGYQDRFLGLLELVRPDLRREIHTLDANPEIVAEMILRNRKSEVTDAAGSLLFRGHEVLRHRVAPSPATVRFQKHLADYLRRGYRASDAGAAEGRAIGFVMVAYRKLASSSIAAIETALRRRAARLDGAEPAPKRSATQPEFDLEDLAGGGDDHDALDPNAPGKAFFGDERALLESLLQTAALARASDEKLRMFLDGIVRPLVEAGKNLLVFTEYRSTQEYLHEALRAAFPNDRVALLHGGMRQADRDEAIRAFGASARFLVSTEAGGEGFNLQEASHILVNYDLPWNPARLAQRIGRLYRYGQREKVLVFNLHTADTFDNQTIAQMLDRVELLARDMAPVGGEFDERLHTEIVGELLEQLDVAAILARARDRSDKTRTDEEIERALDAARRAREMQEEIFANVEAFDPTALAGSLALTMDDALVFVRGMVPMVGGEVVSAARDERSAELRLPEDLRGRFPEFGNRTVVRVTTDRRLAQRRPEFALLDFTSAFFRFLVAQARQPDFGGMHAAVWEPAAPSPAAALAAFHLRWQDERGEPTTERLLLAAMDEKGSVATDPGFVRRWLREGVAAAPSAAPLGDRNVALQGLHDVANRQLAAGTSRFKHPNAAVLLAAADVVRDA